MTDRELLESAARAAGMRVLPDSKPWPEIDGWFFCVQHEMPGMHFRKVGVHPSQYFVEPWRPLTDDGDALRLVVTIAEKHQFHSITWDWVSRGVRVFADGIEGAGPNILSATRRAIVLAAAEIGSRS